MAVVPFWIDCILGGHACAFDITVHVPMYTVTEKLGDGSGVSAGSLYEQESRTEDYNCSRWYVYRGPESQITDCLRKEHLLTNRLQSSP